MFKDFFIYAFEFLPLAASATARFLTQIDGASDFEIFGQVHVATSTNYLLQISDSSSGFQWTDESQPRIPADNWLGSGQRPFRLKPSKIVKRKGSISVVTLDQSGAPNTIRGAFIGAKVWPAAPMQMPRFTEKQPFVYMADFSALGTAPAVPANDQAIDAIQIQADSWFEVHFLTITRTGPATIILENSGPMGRWMDRPIHIDNLGAAAVGAAPVSPAEYQFRLPVPKMVPPASTLSVRVLDLSGAPNTVHVAFHGAKAYA